MNRLNQTLALICLIASSACTKLNKNLVVLDQSAAESNVGTASIKNLNQIAPSMLAVTLCDDRYGTNKRCTATSTPLLTELQVLRPWMSPTGRAESYNPALQLAIMGFAGSVCQLFVSAESAIASGSRKVFNSVNFGLGPNSVTVANRQDIIARLYSNLFSRSPEADETQALLDYFSEAIPTIGAMGSDTQLLMRGVCSVALGSLEFISS